MLIAVINQSTLVSNDQVDIMCQAIQIQLNLHVLSAWNMKTASIKFYADATKVPGYAWVVNMLDNSTQAGALGYHAEDNDKVDAFIFAAPVLQNKGVVLYDSTNPQNVSVASVLSHEVCEMVGDRFAAYWSDGPNVTASDGQTYTEYALELCDPVEGDSYAVTVNGQLVSVSNFVFPSWFNAEATDLNKPFDYLGKLTKPFSMTPGGYMIVRQSGNTQQIFGEKVTEQRQLEVKSDWYRRADVQVSLTNSWMNDPNFLAQSAHFFGAMAVIMTAAHFFGKTGGLITAVMFAALAAVKEFWYDPKYEIPKQTVKDDVLDFTFYMVGVVLAACILLFTK